MHSILPFAEIASRFDRPVSLEQWGLDRLDEIAARHPSGIANTAMTVWHRHVQHGHAKDPQAVQRHIDRHGGSFLDATAAVLGEPVIHDISFSRTTIDDTQLADPVVATLFVARVTPNNLHIADMSLVNPYKPIPPKLRRYRHRKYKGLGLLASVLARAESYAASQNCEFVTLTPETDDLVPLFGKFGFVIEDEYVTTLAMEKRVRQLV